MLYSPSACRWCSAFIAIEDDEGRAWANLLTDEVLQEGQKERQLAEQRGEYHQGVPSVAMSVGVGQRGHTNSYNSKSDVGVMRQKKLPYLGVRNKYCSICVVGERKQELLH